MHGPKAMVPNTDEMDAPVGARDAAPAKREKVDIPDGWKMLAFTKEDNKAGPLLEESAFSVMFPSYREPYLVAIWPRLAAFLLDTHGIVAELDLLNGAMTVKTTRKTWDPTSILSARSMLWMLSRSMTYENALRCFSDDVECDIVKIKNLVASKEKFLKRRQRIVGPNGQTLKALELLTGTAIVVQGTTVSCVGSSRGVSAVRRIVTECMESNVHPVQHIKALMIKRELENIPELANEDWTRFLPSYKKKNIKSFKPKVVANKGRADRPYTNPIPESNIDKAIASGEYFGKGTSIDRKSSAKAERRRQRLQEGKAAEDKAKASARGPPSSEDSEIPSDDL